jgi:hypothetical protein
MTDADKRDRRREAERRYRQANREKLRDAQRRRREDPAVQTRDREAARRYREENPDQVRNSAHRWLDANREKSRESGRRYREANLEKERERQRRYQKANRERYTELNRQWRQRTREQVFAHYGTECACCGTSENLTIDHVDGNGAEHRKELFGAQLGGSRFYAWLIKQGFPVGYQTLCKSCNLSKRRGSDCRLHGSG